MKAQFGLVVHKIGHTLCLWTE